MAGSDESRITEIYSEQPGEDSQATAAAIHGNKVIVAGHSKRVTGAAQLRAVDDVYEFFNRVQFSPFEVYEGLILVLDFQGHLLDRDRLSGGGDVMLAPVGMIGNDVAVGGIFASRSAIARLKLTD